MVLNIAKRALGALAAGLLLLPLASPAMECVVETPVYPDAHYPQVKFTTSHGDFVVELNRRHDDPHSATSQFFFNMKDNESLDPNRKNWGYTVFGEVIEGWDVVETISQVPTGFSEQLGATDVPTTNAIIRSVELMTP